MQIRSGWSILPQVGIYMAKSEWIYDNSDKAQYYLDDNGHYVSGTTR